MQELFSNIIEELEIERTTANNTFVKYEMNVDLGRVFGLEKAIEIVKQEAEKLGTDTNVGSNGWIPVSERLPKENGYYYVTQIVKSISTGKKIAIEKAYVEFSGGKWKRANHLEVMAWIDIEPYQPKGDNDENTN